MHYHDPQAFCASSSQEENKEIQCYFDALPPYVQENIRQSGMHFATVAEMENCAENIMLRRSE